MKFYGKHITHKILHNCLYGYYSAFAGIVKGGRAVYIPLASPEKAIFLYKQGFEIMKFRTKIIISAILKVAKI